MGGAIDFVGDVVCGAMDAIGGAIDFVADGVESIFGGGSGGSYTPGILDTDDHAKKIADELAEKKEEYHELSTKHEKKMLNHINTSMNEFFKEIQNINNQKFGGKSLNINIKDIKKKKEDLDKEVIGHLSSVIDERLVTTDPELSKILDERNDKKRKKAFDAFCKKVQQSARNSLRKKIEDTIDQQKLMVRTEIETRLNEVDQNMSKAKKAYDEILRLKESESSELDYAQMKHIYTHELYDILLNQLSN